MAKQNIKEKYLLVGTTDDILTFLQTLEVLMPHLFEGASGIYLRKGWYIDFVIL